MKLLAALCAAGLSLLAGDLSPIKTIYLMPMASGLDQYLATRLTTDGAFQVVTDPQKADAIFTDRIGSAFEQQFNDLFTPKKPTDGKLENDTPGPVGQSVSRAKGSIFLVDRNSRVVLWSTYALPKSKSSHDLNDLAGRIVAQLEKTRKGK